jgi:hypothetical protein
MITVTLQSNKLREERRPPRLVMLPTPDLLARLVPVRRKPVRGRTREKNPLPAQAAGKKTDGYMPEVVKTDPTPLPGRNGLKKNPLRAPLSQSSMDILRLSMLSQRATPAQEAKPAKIDQPPPPPVDTAQPPFNGTPVQQEPLDFAPDLAEPMVEQQPVLLPETTLEEPSLPAQAVELQPQMEPPQVESGETENEWHISPSLVDLINQNPDLPPQSIILGVCEDGLPLALDLFDPAPGALLVMGDVRADQLDLLHFAVTSSVSRNSPRAVQFLVISHQPETWQSWISYSGYDRYCITVTSAQGDQVGDWIVRLADWTEQRRLGQRSGPPILLIIDTLAFLPHLPYDIRLNFDWMIKEGPQAQIWPLAAISTDLAISLSPRMLRSFQSRFIGSIEKAEVYQRLSGMDEQQTAEFNRPGCFSVQVGERWLQFSLPAETKI